MSKLTACWSRNCLTKSESIQSKLTRAGFRITTLSISARSAKPNLFRGLGITAVQPQHRWFGTQRVSTRFLKAEHQRAAADFYCFAEDGPESEQRTSRHRHTSVESDTTCGIDLAAKARITSVDF